MSRTYSRYCPVAHALDVLGERWALLLVHELLGGPLRFTDLEERLHGIGTNILSARLKTLEQHRVVAKRRLAPPAASTVYELTEYGRAVQPVLHELAWWGIRSLGPPAEGEELHPGWLLNALRVGLDQEAADAPETTVEFRSGEEVVTVRIEDGRFRVARECAVEPDAVVDGTPRAYYALLVERDPSGVQVEGDLDALLRLLRTVPEVERVG